MIRRLSCGNLPCVDNVSVSKDQLYFSVSQRTSLIGLLLLIATFLICNAKSNVLWFKTILRVQ